MTDQGEQVSPVGEMSPLAEHRAQVEERILAAAERLFFEKGASGLSMRRLADALNLTPAAIYRYFDSKDALIRALRNAFFNELLVRLEEVTQSSDHPVDALRAGLIVYIRFALEKPYHYGAAFSVESAEHIKQDRSIEFGGADKPNLLAFRYLVNCLQEIASAFDMQGVDFETMARSMWASVHGLSLLMIKLPHWPKTDRNALIKAHVDQMLVGAFPNLSQNIAQHTLVDKVRQENDRLRRAISDLTLDNLVLRDFLRDKFK